MTVKTQRPRPVMLTILDGFGWRDLTQNNAVRLSAMPNFHKLWENNPHTLLEASGEAVGLPIGQMGNSEVGHLTLGAGRRILQELPRLTHAAKNDEFKDRPAIKELMDVLRKTGGTCHIMGLTSEGGVHSHLDHLIGAVKTMENANIPVVVHFFADGRDTAQRCALEVLEKLETALPKVKIATVSGRYFAMDRDNRWDRVQKAYDVIALAKGPHYDSAKKAIEAAYAEDKNDEFVPPSVIDGYQGAKKGDGLWMINFRADRAGEILQTLLLPDFKGFERPVSPAFAFACGMTPYAAELNPYLETVFPKENIEQHLGEIVAKAGLSQLRIAETEKYPHVTYFFNGGDETPAPKEDRKLIASPKVATYDLQPEMSAGEVTDEVVSAIDSGKYDLIILNYANPDMVGHTGMLDAAITACQAVDQGLGRIEAALEKQGGVMLVTADHGNCETMKDEKTGKPHTSHTTNPVPLILADFRKGEKEVKEMREGGSLADIAPTLLHFLQLEQPELMSGKTLIKA
ncbi:2,3-bisphosphoglycerate-independent phosphoglycerate mutase [Acetobacteraceae bacterium]|nr:2,3-bisphosphoglycerate-independent phosphoglycerate mutase [Acetobacteraceae bacterium]